ncbi:hypothetical protein AB1K91_11360 [Terribacillus sp. 179-K 1B1 HS]|uniref:hypothetical protein n=1 Tax=Terribacillus sp. 179-K 1B1 HS TaxID=3142388 RepID=UPI0039A1A239
MAYNHNLQDGIDGDFTTGKHSDFRRYLAAITVHRNASNQSHAHNKGYLGYKTGEIRLFTFRVSPIILGVISFALVSLIATVIYYASYF